METSINTLRQRKILLILFGGLLSATLAWAFLGGWERLYLLCMRASIARSAAWREGIVWFGPFLAALAGGLTGLFMAHLEKRRYGGVISGMLGFALVSILIITLDDFINFFLVAFPIYWIIFPAQGLLITGGLLLATEWLFPLKPRFTHLQTGLALAGKAVFTVIFGLSIVWPVFITRPDPKIPSLLSVNQDLRARGYTGYTLELASGSSWPHSPATQIRAYLVDGSVADYTCSYHPKSGSTCELANAD